ncbi:MAG: excinuclease ABC subunit UvrC, partial [Actinomycetota bacterium]
IRDTLDLLLRTFPVRTCSPGKFNQHSKLGRPCLLFHIEKCSGPCVGEVEKQSYDAMVTGLCEFLEGDVDAVVSDLEDKMQRSAEAQEYEVAGRTRDRLHAVRRASEKQLMVGERDEDFDVVAVADDELEASVQVFFVRKGRVLGRKGYILDKVEELSVAGVVGRTIESLYGDPPPLGVPKFVLVPELPAESSVYEEWLKSLRGTRVDIRVPQKGDKRELLATVTRNASEEFLRHRLRRASDHNARSRALTELQDALGLPEAPLRIECYDMAHLQGQDYVGSMVVMEDGLPVKREYRKFKVRTVEGNDDYAAMGEVLRRRLEAYVTERDTPRDEGSKPGKFAYPPQLLLVDGGKGQLGVAIQVIAELGLEDEIPVASLAKRYEEVYIPGRSEPVRIGRGSDALFMLQRIRDEAHRFANTFHREVRGKRMLESELDGIPGLGKTRANRLLAELGDIKAVKSATREQLTALSWLPSKVADSIFSHFHSDASSEESQS